MAKKGRPPQFKDAKELAKAFDDYFKECEEKKEHPNVSGLQCFVELYSDNFFKEQARRGDDFSKTVKNCQRRMFDRKFQAAAKGEMNPTIFIFDAVNNHGMVNTKSENKNDTKISGSLDVKNASREELEAEIEALEAVN